MNRCGKKSLKLGLTLATWMILMNGQVVEAAEPVEMKFPEVMNVTNKKEMPELKQFGGNYWYSFAADKKGLAYYTRAISTDSADENANRIKRYKKGEAYVGNYGATSLHILDEAPSDFVRRTLISPAVVEIEEVEPKSLEFSNNFPIVNIINVELPQVKEKLVVIPQLPAPAATDVAFQEVPANVRGYAKKIDNGSQSPVNGGLMAQLDLTSGTFNLYSLGDKAHEYSFTNAHATNGEVDPNATPPVNDGTQPTEPVEPTADPTVVMSLPESDSGILNAEAFYRMGGRPLNTIGEKVVINATGNVAEGRPLNSIFYLGNNRQANSPESKLINHGTVNLYGNKIAVVNIDNVNSQGNITFVNEGSIIAHNERGLFAEGKEGNEIVGNHIFGGFSYADAGVDHIENGVNGKIIFYSPSSIGWAYTSSNTQRVRRQAVNNGLMQLWGKRSLGVTTDGDASSDQVLYADIMLNKPIELYGDESVGVNILTAPTNGGLAADHGLTEEEFEKIGFFFKSRFAVKIGGNENPQGENGNSDTGDVNTVDNSVGLNFSFDQQNTNIDKYYPITYYKVDLAENVKNSVAIRVGNAKIDIKEGTVEESKITLNGKNNIGFLADGSGKNENGGTSWPFTLNYENTANSFFILGKDNILFAAKAGGIVNVTKPVIIKNTDIGTGVSLAYASEENAAVNLKEGWQGELVGAEAVVLYANNTGTITVTEPVPVVIPIPGGNNSINNTALGTPKLTVSGDKAIAFYSKDGTINATGGHIKLTNATVGAFADGANANININNSILDFSGEGYAVHSANGGHINLRDSMLVLRGKSVGFDEALLANIDITNVKIVPMSNNVAVFKVANKGIVNLTNFEGDLGIAAATVVLGEENGEVYRNFKKALVDGITTLNLDENVNKKEAAGDDASNLSYQFVRNYIIKRAKVNLLSNKSVTAVLTNEELAKLNTNTVVGLSMASSTAAVNNEEAQINLAANTMVTADRDGDGAGAVGLIINYGKINVADTARIGVEKENNKANENAVGIYAVNGSVVNNAGTINVGGNRSIGLLGMAYRLDDHSMPVTEEYEGKPDAGAVALHNTGVITLDGEGARGIFVNNNKTTAASDEYLGENSGTIELSGNESVGMSAMSGTLLNKQSIVLTGNESKGMMGDKSSRLVNDVAGSIKVPAADTKGSPAIGMVGMDANTVIENKGNITVKDGSYGIYGSKVSVSGGKIIAGMKGIGIYGKALADSKIDVDAAAAITVGDDGIGILTTGEEPITINNAGALTIGDKAYGYVLKSKGANLTSTTAAINMKNESMFIYSVDPGSTIINKTAVTATGNKNFAIYAAGNVTNLANIDFSAGVGNIGLFLSDAGHIKNGDGNVNPTITVGSSNKEKSLYSVGMVAVSKKGAESIIENLGTINALQPGSIGMYAIGRQAKAINRGTINLGNADAIGMYISGGAEGLNYGTITTTSDATGEGILGVAISDGAVLKNYGRIIVKGNQNIGAFTTGGGTYTAETGGSVTAEGGASDIVNEGVVDATKKIGSIEIVAPPGSAEATVLLGGVEIPVVAIDTPMAAPDVDTIMVGAKEKKVADSILPTYVSKGSGSELGLYIDTSGVNYTKPIEGLEHITKLEKVDLILGNEASRYTTAKSIAIGDNIIKPYNDMITEAVKNSNRKKVFSVLSNSYSWIATSTLNNTGSLNEVYLVKVPYTDFAKDPETHNFMAGLEDAYGKAEKGILKDIFNSLNDIGKSESALFVQSIDEMKGHQYANRGRRLSDSHDLFEREFKAVKQWTNASDTLKIKAFGEDLRYRNETLGLKDYDKKSVGVMLLQDNPINVHTTEGWFAGVAYDRFYIRDIGGSKERAVVGEFGKHKTVALPEHNAYYTWKAGFLVSERKMTRKYFIVDKVYRADANYSSVGAFAELTYGSKHAVQPGLTVRPEVGIELGFHHLSGFKESGEGLNLQGNAHDVVVLKPTIGLSVDYERLEKNGKFIANMGIEVGYDIGKRMDKAQRMSLSNINSLDYGLVVDNQALSIDILGSLAWQYTDRGFAVRWGYDWKNDITTYGVEARFKFN